MSGGEDRLAVIGAASILSWLALAILFSEEARVAAGVSIIIAGFTGLAITLTNGKDILYRSGLAITVIFFGLAVAGVGLRYVIAGWLLSLAALLVAHAMRGAGSTPRRP